MDLRSHSPYWLLKNGLISNYPSISQNHRADVIVMGAGITGALVAWHLVNAGFSVCVLDKRHAGMGSTAASTALLQYEIDTPLHELAGKVGYNDAVKAYWYCAEAIEKIGKIADRFNIQAAYKKRPSLQYASFKSHVGDLEKEYKLRKKEGFPVYWWDEPTIAGKMGFSAPAAIYSNLGAEVDAYLLCHQLLDSCQRMGACVYDNTEVTAINHFPRKVEVTTHQGLTVTGSHLVIACGYESQIYVPQKVETIHATYAMVSEPLPDWQPWFKNCLIWETADPYLYMRTTRDRRILVGGLDDEFYQPDKRDRRIPQKTKKLLAAFHQKFPDIPFVPDFQWAGAFAKTKDGLPYIGSIPERPRTSFALGFGGNGITFSLIAAEMIRDQLGGKKNPDQHIFRFNR